MIRLALSCIALVIFAADAGATHRRPVRNLVRAVVPDRPLLRSRIVHRERFVQRAPARVLVPFAPRSVPIGAGCGPMGCPAKK